MNKRRRVNAERNLAAALKPASAPLRLRYVTDDEPGIRRVRSGAGFVFRRANGRTVRDPKTLARIRSLVIPPAWTDVWICAHPGGHLQAVGRDAAGRKQYRYHPAWRAKRDATKYARLALFGKLLPTIRARVRRDLNRPGMPREKVAATIVRLMETTHIRIGNEEYARSNGSYGLTTLKDRHVEVRRGGVRFQFRGKSGKWRDVEIDDPRVAAIVRRCRDLPGQKLFQYLDADGRRRTIGSADVNDYLRDICGEEITAKDFRTWAGTLWAARELQDVVPPESQAQRKRVTAEIVRAVAERLGNTEAVCRKCYIHPLMLEAVGDATLRRLLDDHGERRSMRRLEARLIRFLSGSTRRRAA